MVNRIFECWKGCGPTGSKPCLLIVDNPDKIPDKCPFKPSKSFIKWVEISRGLNDKLKPE